MTITLGWWALPTFVTLAAYAWAFSTDKGRDTFGLGSPVRLRRCDHREPCRVGNRGVAGMSLVPSFDGHYDENGQWRRTKFCFVYCGDRCTCSPPGGVQYRPDLDKNMAGPGETLGHGHPDWPADLTTFAERRAYQRGIADARRVDKEKPLDMVLHCPRCGHQHTDKPEDGWANPPHRSHKCSACGCIWRPADVPTNGVAAVQTRGKADTWLPPAAPAGVAILSQPQPENHMDTSNLQPHQQRVVAEKAELDDRLNKLLAFTAGPIFGKLDEAERGRLTEQAQYMQAYSNVLGQRIAAFAP